MAKIDDTLAALESGFQNPVTVFSTVWVEDKDMEKIKLRRKKVGQTHHKAYYLSIGEQGQPPAVFYGHKFSDCVKQALTWRGLPTTSKGKNAPPKQAAQG